jgi:uncharacterized membrane protein YccC
MALFAASSLGVHESFWATLVVLMVMRHEGIASLELTIHYAVGTIVGVLLGAAILHLGESAITLAVLATLVAALARVGTAINPALALWHSRCSCCSPCMRSSPAMGAQPHTCWRRDFMT